MCALIEITHILVRPVPLHLFDLVGEVVPAGRSATPVAILERARVREVVGVENTEPFSVLASSAGQCASPTSSNGSPHCKAITGDISPVPCVKPSMLFNDPVNSSTERNHTILR